MNAELKERYIEPTTPVELPSEYEVTREEYARYFGKNFFDRKRLYYSSFLPKARNHFTYVKQWIATGDTTPVAVVDARRHLIACFTRLGTSTPSGFPVIRVLREKLSLIEGGARQGQRLAGISVYFATVNSLRAGRFKTFRPIVIDSICTDPAQCAQVKAKIPQSDWQALDLGLAQIPYPVQEGLYRIKLPLPPLELPG